jgi:CubicO group peptidase (beta-lactamase class C family)
MTSRYSARIDALFAPWSAAHGMPGAAVRVTSYGDVIHSGDYGLADIGHPRRIAGDTAFLLASLTKQFTAMAVMILAENGAVTYDQRLSEFLLGFPDYAREVTIRNLLQHTSGLQEFEDLFVSAKQISPPDDPNDGWPRSASSTPSSYEPTTADTVELLKQYDLEFAPGDQKKYSNSGYVLLARIVEVLSGQSFPDFVKQRIFDPLGMDQSSVPVTQWRTVPQRATSYSWRSGAYADIDYTPLNNIYGEDGIYTTAEDMVRWDQALYTATLVKQSTLEEAFRPGKLNNGEPIDTGFGWFIGPEYADHEGGWLGFRTYIRRYRSRRLGIIVLANCAELNAAAMGGDIADILLGE